MKLQCTLFAILAFVVIAYGNECTQGETKTEDCNQCICSQSGFWACTQALCPLAVRTRRELPPCEADEGMDCRFRRNTPTQCTPGERFQVECNWCVCTPDGKDAACTLKLCN